MIYLSTVDCYANLSGHFLILKEENQFKGSVVFIYSLFLCLYVASSLRFQIVMH